MLIQNRGLLGLPDLPVVSDIGNAVHSIGTNVGNGLKSLLAPPKPSPTPQPKPTHPNPPPPPAPTHTQPASKPPPPPPSSNPKPGSGSPKPGNGSPPPSTGGSSPGNSNGSGSTPPAGTPAQPPTLPNPAPTDLPSSGTSPADGQPEPISGSPPSPSVPIQNVSGDPDTPLGSTPQHNGSNADNSDSPSSDPDAPNPAPSATFSSYITLGSSVFGVSGSSTIALTLQPTVVASDGSSNAGSGGNGSSSHHKGLSSVGIGLISAVLVLVGLVCGLFIIRRVHQRRRADRRTRWTPVMLETGSAANGSRSSVRSSFATTFDYGLRAQTPLPNTEVPSLPPLPQVSDPKRASGGSDHSQWLMVDRVQGSSEDLLGGNTDAPLTPLSVAPFTPSEKYKFPQPPRTGTEPDEDSPFSDLNAVTEKPALNRTQTDKTEQSIYSQPSFNDKPVLAAGLSAAIKRPFQPSLPDELLVVPGQVVTIEEMFDDGWNLVKTPEGARGLVPLACFEDVDQLAGKRRSSLIDFTN